MESDRDIKTWEARLKDQSVRHWQNYVHRQIDLGTARIDEMFAIPGEFIVVEDFSGLAAKAKIKLQKNTNDALDLERGVEIHTVFTQVYITNEALSGEWLDVVFGINFEYYKKNVAGEAQPAIIITNVAADANTVGAAHVCKSALIRAHTTNTGLVWVNFGAAAVENQCYPLDTGDAMQVPLSNTNRINALFKVANEDLTVIYQV